MDLLNLVPTTDETTIKNSAFLNVYLNQGEQKLQIIGIGLENQINSKFTTKNQKSFYKKLLDVANKMQEGEIKVLINGTITLELLKVKSEGNSEMVDSLISMLNL